MRNTVPASFKPSGVVAPPACGARREDWDQGPAIGRHRIPCTLPTAHDGEHQDGLGNTWTPAAPDGNPVVEDRTVTYPLIGGGTLAAVCPAWCTSDHAQAIEGGLHPVDLCHEGDQVALSFTTADGSPESILAARITQFPFAGEGDGSERPHLALMAEAGSGETLGYLSPAEFDTEIRRVEKHLQELRRMSEQLAAHRAEAHAQYHRSLEGLGRGTSGRWASLRLGDVETMPVPYLLEVFGVTVVEVDTDELPADRFGHIEDTGGGLALYIDRTLPQALRESTVRGLLLRHAAFAKAQS